MRKEDLPAFRQPGYREILTQRNKEEKKGERSMLSVNLKNILEMGTVPVIHNSCFCT
jgi:hypothetical protein